MNKRILIITADNLGLSKEQIDYRDLEILKFPVIVDGIEYCQSAEYDAAWLIERFVKEGVVAKSTSIVKGELIELIEANKDKYDLIIHVVMSSVMSAATFAMAENVREMYANTIPIINIDSRQAVTGVGNVLMGVIDIIKEHDDADDIVRLSQEIVKNTFNYVVIPDLNYLAKGGRIGKARALMGSVLRIIPIVGLMGDDEEGSVVPLDKGRTFKQVNQKIIDLMEAKMAEKSATQIRRIVMNDVGDNQEVVSDLEEKLKSLPCNEMIHGKTDLVGAVYLGPRAYCLAMTL